MSRSVELVLLIYVFAQVTMAPGFALLFIVWFHRASDK